MNSEISAGQNEPDGSVVRATVIHAFTRNPRLPWTPGSLASWYGLRIDLVGAALADLRARGVVRPLGGDRSDVVVWARPGAERRSVLWPRRGKQLHPSAAQPAVSLVPLGGDAHSGRSGTVPTRPRPAAAGASP